MFHIDETQHFEKQKRWHFIIVLSPPGKISFLTPNPWYFREKIKKDCLSHHIGAKLKIFVQLWPTCSWTWKLFQRIIPFFLGLYCQNFWNTHNFGKFSRVPTRLVKNLEEIERGLRKIDTQFQVIIQKFGAYIGMQNKIRKILPPLRASVKRAAHRWYRVVFLYCTSPFSGPKWKQSCSASEEVFKMQNFLKKVK